MGVLLIASGFVEAANLLPNPDFEEGLKGWTTQVFEGDARFVEFAVDEKVYRSGTSSVRITSTNADVRARSITTTSQSLGCCIRVVLSGQVWVKIDISDPSSVPSWTWNGVEVRMTSHAADWREVHHSFLQPVSIDEEGWVLFEGTTVLPQEEPVGIQFELFLMNTIGTVWFDSSIMEKL